MPSLFLSTLARKPIIFDGAMGTATHARDLDIEKDFWGKENCPEVLVLARPDVISEIHESFLVAGADVLETCTFGGMPHVLAEFDLQDRCREINIAAASIARDVARKHSTSDKPRFVAGSMGPGTKLITLGNIDWESMFASYKAQASGLIEGGVDCFIIETCQDLLQVSAGRSWCR